MQVRRRESETKHDLHFTVFVLLVCRPPMSLLSAFVRRCKAALPSLVSGQHVVRIVMGNESCDLDSMASALVYAHALTQHHSAGDGALHLPIMNTPRIEFPLRTEVRGGRPVEVEVVVRGKSGRAGEAERARQRGRHGLTPFCLGRQCTCSRGSASTRRS